jgi:hypothetical protein
MFSIDQNTATASNASYLSPNKIHTVTFKGAEATQVGNDTKYDVLKLKFENEEGVFEDTIFPPKLPEGAVRKTDPYLSPSEVEELMAKLRHYISALNPDLDKQIEAGTKTLAAKDWNQLRAVMVKALEKGVNKEIQLKLMANNKNMAVVPGYILAISKNGNTYLRTKFIGDKVTFTDKEIEKMSKQASAKPTDMASVIGGKSASSDLDDLDLDDL